MLSAPPSSLARLAPDQWTAPFWAAARRGVLVGQKCAHCGRFRMPPSAFCGYCRSQEIVWQELSGRATLFSYTVVHHPPTAELAAAVPYAICMVELDGAPDVRLISNLVQCADEDLFIGQTLEVVWDNSDPNVTIPRFTPVAA